MTITDVGGDTALQTLPSLMFVLTALQTRPSLMFAGCSKCNAPYAKRWIGTRVPQQEAYKLT